MNNVLLLYPEFPDTFWAFKHALPFVLKKAAFPPLGLVTVAALLPKDWNIRLVDENISHMIEADLKWADVAMISAMTVQRKSAFKSIHRCKQAGVKVIAGGPLFSVEWQNFHEVDHFLLGEAETTMATFIEQFLAGTAPRVTKAPEPPDMTTSPIPRWELLKMKHYASMSVQATRGCPFDCDFCNVTTLFGNAVRLKTSAQIITELDALKAAGWHGSVFFVDDNFIGNKRMLKADLLPALAHWQNPRKPTVFQTQASVNLARDPELMNLMVSAGFDTVFLGIETTSPEGLAECSKKQNEHRDLEADVRAIHQAGLQVQAGFIVGFDSDGPSAFQRQINFIQASGIVTAMVGILQAPPGTALYRRLYAEGRIKGSISGDNADGSTNVITKMDAQELQDGYQALMQYIYSPQQFYARVRTFLKDYKAPRFNQPLSLEKIHALIGSILRLGIFSRGRLYFWSLLIWTTIHRPRLFPIAITQTIYGYHFRRVCELNFQ